MASDPTNTGAAFTYSLELDVIKIQAFNAGTPERNAWRTISKTSCARSRAGIKGPSSVTIMYLESNGLWTGVDWDGKSLGFFALGETDESGATKKLIAIRPRMLGG